ncbi:serine protease inhibitor dipetalogastin-like [Portunus trituberculatus]|uniref:serine protease inhibitor dipetalogastin-like n=1 Tax=Portunus trituberculatus TaxID=210409 RepID=UPI001E1CE42B|nr:serine protease inhibitor dipetalogastin-like [Portunus trituberculatus]
MSEFTLNRTVLRTPSMLPDNGTGDPCAGFVICDRIYTPVCGSDSKTYGNKCGLVTEHCFFNPALTVAYEGECEEEATEAAEVVPTTPNTRDEQVHNAVSQANTPNNFLALPTVVKHYITKVCETFQDLNILATRMDRLYCFIQKPTEMQKNPKCLSMY